MARQFNPFPDPKKGKGRMVLKRPASAKTPAWKKVAYVRGVLTVPPRGVRREQTHWKRTMTQLLSRSDTQIVKTLIEDKLLPDWSGKKGILSKSRPRCFWHFFFVYPWHRRLEEIRRKFVEKKEKHIVFGKSKTWIDVEGDEVTFDRHDISQDPVLGHEVKGDKCVLWEQWCGLVRRGKPETLIMTRLKPGLTVHRAPGPGPISKHDWTPLGKKHLAGKNIIFHTDSARAYKLKLRDVLHDSVVHKKKRVKKSLKRLHFKIRAAQYEYWYRGSDMWKCTGDLVQDHMSGIVAQP
ncbi:Uncharacterized protein SCF082_LOCUS26631 [Durusdinium trenchii]|uniref:Transposase n=1 Tax=Durusdinium trenchii TaxID=1381693 RepID=A0ABP0M7V9_9DINO